MLETVKFDIYGNLGAKHVFMLLKSQSLDHKDGEANQM